MSVERHSLDANVLFYALDASAGDKHRIAMQLWMGMRQRAGVLALQTLTETYWAVHRKRPQELEIARHFLTLATERLTVIPAHPSDFLNAAMVHAQRPMHFWDALLGATLRRGGCVTLLTEDTLDRPESGGLRYVNPFTAAAEALAPYVSG